jgi:hypothetical protein
MASAQENAATIRRGYELFNPDATQSAGILSLRWTDRDNPPK